MALDLCANSFFVVIYIFPFCFRAEESTYANNGAELGEIPTKRKAHKIPKAYHRRWLKHEYVF